MLALLGVCMLTVMRPWKTELSPLLRVAMVLLLGTMLLGLLSPLVTYAVQWLGVQEGGYASILLRALGVAFLTHYAAEVCRECGESAMAGSVELVGKAEILLLCLPLVEQLLGVAQDLLALGG